MTVRCIERWPNDHLSSPYEHPSRSNHIERLLAHTPPTTRGFYNSSGTNDKQKRLDSIQRLHNAITRHLRLPTLQPHRQVLRVLQHHRRLMRHSLAGRRTMSSERGLAVVRLLRLKSPPRLKTRSSFSFTQRIYFLASYFPISLILQGVWVLLHQGVWGLRAWMVI